MLSKKTRKSILYLDQNFFSSVHRGNDPKWTAAMEKVKEVLDLQLLAIPYSSIHENEADFAGDHRDGLIHFIQKASRGHRFEPDWKVQETQILKAFQAFLDNKPTSYQKEERDALFPSVHDWDGDYSISVFSAATDVIRKCLLKQQSIEELLKVLPEWANKARTFKDDMNLEFHDQERLLVDGYTEKVRRLMMGDFSALIDSPISASVVESMRFVVEVREADLTMIGAFFRSKHFTEIPAVQLSARLFSTFKKRVRDGMFPKPDSVKTRKKLSGFLDDVSHASTYAPYCDAFFTDEFMVGLMKDKLVSVPETYGCKVFSAKRMQEFFAWLDEIKSRMPREHAVDLAWKYERYRSNLKSGPT